MALPVSSLSVAMQAVAEFLDAQFGPEVIVTLETPEKAAETAKASNKVVLNAFTYRLAPSGVHADAGSGDPLFLRAQVLLTCFPNGTGTVEPDTDLRVLGHAISVLHSLPSIPVILLGAVPVGAGPEDFRTRNPVIYQLQAHLLAPAMEELNHIWTTQGGELAYRLSLAYELALIPVEPLSRRVIALPPVVAVVEVAPSPVPVLADGLSAPGTQPMALPLGEAPVDWAPVMVWAVAGGLVSAQAVPAGTAALPMMLAGPPGARVAVTVTWTRAGGAVVLQPVQAFTLAALRLDDPAGQVNLALQSAAAGDRAEVRAVPADAAGVPVPGAVGGNLLSLTVGV
jgi:hypothetical protein